MTLLDRLKDGVSAIVPDKRGRPPMSSSLSGGIGSGNGVVGFEDDMIVSKPAIIFHTSQVFFNFLAMCCFASVAAFQAKWGVGPSGLTGFALFVSIAGMFLSLFMLLVPVVYERYDRLTRLARALKELRVSFILVGTGTTFSLLIAFIVTISAWTEAGCKNADNDPNADKGDDFKNGLDGWCSTKKAGAVFFWLAFAFWIASVVLAVLDWRSGKSNGPRDPPFTHPTGYSEAGDEAPEDEESTYEHIPPIRSSSPLTYPNESQSPFADANRYSSATTATNPNASSTNVSAAPYNMPAPSRPSMDAYGAFSDPAPSGFGAGGVQQENPRVSRTMQYADPYAAVRASVASGQGAQPSGPPSYSYQGYQ